MTKNKDYMESLLADLIKREQKANIEYAACLPGSLVQVTRNGKPTYFQVIHTKDERNRVSLNKHPDMIQSLARKKYLETELKILNRDITLLQKMLKSYIEASADTIMSHLPTRYQRLPEKYFYDNIPIYNNERFQDWANQPYNQSTYEPSEKSHTTARGLKVRSKSEVIIAEKLDAYRIPYRYEQMLYIEQYSFSPDFTILTQNGLKYWEHCGKVNDENYMNRHKWKISQYEKRGIVPWKNLVITYDDIHGGLDSRLIEAEIKYKLL